VEARLERLVRLIVPRMADLCTVRLSEPDGSLRLAAVAHADPEGERVARRAYSRYVALDTASGLGRVLATARSELVPEVTDAMLRLYAPDDEFLEDLRTLAPRSVMLVPLIARGGAIGAMSVVAAGSGRRFGERDLAIAEDLGRRAGLALDNARLLEEERDARAGAEAARERVARLQRLGAALGSALGRDEVARLIVAEGMAAVDAEGGAVALRAGEECVTVAADGYSATGAAELARFPLDAPLPLAEAIRTGQPVWREEQSTRLALPLIVGGRAIGGLGFRFAAPERSPDGTDRAFLLALAGQCAQALERAERYEAEHRVALTLQRSLLPPPPPSIAGIEVALRYLPAGEGLEAGGDWYDVIGLGGDRVGIAVGDVVGRGVEAAAVMGQLQSALRAFALQGEAPATVMGRLARFAADIPQASMATVAYAVLDLQSGGLRYARAGHPPPLLVRSDGRTAYLEDGRGAPLAALPGPDYEEGIAELGPGDMLLLYSDGLVERRREVIDEGLNRLARAAAPASGAGAEEVCDRVLGALFGDRTPGDDVVLLVLRRTAAAAPLAVRVPAVPGQLSTVRGELRRWLTAAGATDLEAQDVLVACGEALANAVEHAYRGGEAGEIDLRVTLGPDGLLDATVRDFGRWQPPRLAADRGRGLALMDALMDEVEIVRGRGGTQVVLRRRIEAAS
jgi:GAF domain-containing protein/anti-sigma regulatory factor (Ser/Thr protein kinase)